jgi:hypothetical protein
VQTFTRATSPPLPLQFRTSLPGPELQIQNTEGSINTWVCVVFTTWSTEYAFESRDLRILAINTGYSLTGMIIMGVILSTWRRKPGAN